MFIIYTYLSKTFLYILWIVTDDWWWLIPIHPFLLLKMKSGKRNFKSKFVIILNENLTFVFTIIFIIVVIIYGFPYPDVTYVCTFVSLLLRPSDSRFVRDLMTQKTDEDLYGGFISTLRFTDTSMSEKLPFSLRINRVRIKIPFWQRCKVGRDITRHN